MAEKMGTESVADLEFPSTRGNTPINKTREYSTLGTALRNLIQKSGVKFGRFVGPVAQDLGRAITLVEDLNYPALEQEGDVHAAPRVGLLDLSNTDAATLMLITEICEERGIPALISGLEETKCKPSERYPDGVRPPLVRRDKAVEQIMHVSSMSESISVPTSQEMMCNMLLDESKFSEEEVEAAYGVLSQAYVNRMALIDKIIKLAGTDEYRELMDRFTKREWCGNTNQQGHQPPLQECVDLQLAFFRERCGYPFICHPPLSGQKTTINRWKKELVATDYRHYAKLCAIVEDTQENAEQLTKRKGDIHKKAVVARVYGPPARGDE